MKPKRICQLNTLGTKKERAIAALVQHGNKESAAQEAGVHPATLWRWMQRPDFQQALQEARRQAFAQSTGRLQQASSAAVTTLLRVMTDAQASPGSKLRAALCVLEFSQRSLEVERIAARLAELEKD